MISKKSLSSTIWRDACRNVYHLQKLNEVWLHVFWLRVRLCTYCVNDVQHVVGFSRLKRDNGVQWSYQTVAENEMRYKTLSWNNADILQWRGSDWLFGKVEVRVIGHLGSWHALMGEGSWLLSGRKLKNSRMLSKASTSFSKAWWATPESKTWDTVETLKTICFSLSLFELENQSQMSNCVV